MPKSYDLHGQSIPWNANVRHDFRRAMNRQTVNDRPAGSRRRPASRRMRQAFAEHDERQPIEPFIEAERGFYIPFADTVREHTRLIAESVLAQSIQLRTDELINGVAYLHRVTDPATGKITETRLIPLTGKCPDCGLAALLREDEPLGIVLCANCPYERQGDEYHEALSAGSEGRA